jgi:hypothetical protein
MGFVDTTDKKKRRKKVADEEGKCDRCPPHDGENRRKRPRPDKYKDHRRKK